MISYITCSNNIGTLDNNLRKSLILKDNDELIVIENPTSLAYGYNSAAKKAKNKIKAFVHHDVVIKDNNRLRKELISNADAYGIIGVIGSRDVPYKKQWWLSSDVAGSVEDKNFGNIINSGGGEKVMLLDGLFIATNKDILFDEGLDTFGWNDLDICLESNKRGYENFCLSNGKDLMFHNSERKDDVFTLPGWKKSEAYYISKWFGDSRELIKKETPLISVTMLTYKRKEMFKATIDSFLAKNTYPNMEFLVWVNETDTEYEELINSYGNLFTFKKFSKENIGIGTPRNVLTENAKGKYILNLEDDWECVADNDDDFLARSVKCLEKYEDVGQVVLRDVPMEGYSDAEVGELRDDCYIMINRYAHMSPTYTNQAAIMPKHVWEELGPFKDQNQETEFGKLYDQKYKSVKLGHTPDVGAFHHIGFVSAASAEDSKRLNTFFCGNPRAETTNFKHVGLIRFVKGEELFVDAMLQEMLPVMDKIVLAEPNVDIWRNPLETSWETGSFLVNKYINNPKIKYVRLDVRYFKDPEVEFSNAAYDDVLNYNMCNSSVYKAIEISKVEGDWFFVFDGDEVVSRDNFKKIFKLLDEKNSDEALAFAVPTVLYSKYINGLLNKPAFTPLCIMSNSGFHLMEANRGKVVSPMNSNSWGHLKGLPADTLNHFSYVSPKRRNKYDITTLDNHKGIGKNYDYMINSQISYVDIGTLPKGILHNIKEFEEDELIMPKKVERGQTVCLNMIVKNEEANIIKYFPKLANFIDEYMIVDTGSTDNTKDAIRKIFDDIPGVILDHPFDDYSSSRNDGLAQIKSDWVLFLDADHELNGDLSYLNKLDTLDSSTNMVEFNWEETGLTLLTRRLARNTGLLKWSGRAHEILRSQEGWRSVFTEDLIIYHHNTGSGKVNKFEREIALLKADFDDTESSRACFYIGCDYYWSGDYSNAIDWFTKYDGLVCPDKWPEEKYKSKLYRGRSYQKLDRDDEAISCYDEAIVIDKEMSEPHVWKAEIFLKRGDQTTAVDLCLNVPNIKHPKKVLWVETDVYDFTRYQILSIGCWYCGKYKEGLAATDYLIKVDPHNELHRNNKEFYVKSLNQGNR